MKKLYKIFTLLAMVIGLALASNAQTTVSSIISSNQTWTAKGSPYLITANALIESGVKVTVEPGAHIRTTTTGLKLIVDGSFEAIGKKDSVITVDSLTLEFTDKSVGYDVATKKGSQFQFVFFNCVGSGGSKVIDLKSKSMLVKNCKFFDGYYIIYSYSAPGKDTTDLILENSVFRGVTSTSGYMVYSSGNTRLQITDCYADRMGGLIISKWTTIKRSTFRNFSYSSGIRQTSGLELILECNLFQNFRYRMLDLSYTNNNQVIELNQNTFDSCDVLLALRAGATYKPKKMVIKNNNFLRYNKNTVAVSIGSAPGQADTLDLTKNYWGTTTKSDIETGIKDFTDDITIGGYVDFTGYLTSPVSACSSGGTIGGADTSGVFSSVDPIIENFKIAVYPNPANNSVSVDGNGSTIQTVKILDLHGKLIQQVNINDIKSSIDVSMIVDGLYIIEVSSETRSAYQKILIKH